MSQCSQTFEIDSACAGGNRLILISDYGLFESNGYSCDATDAHNYIQEASYGINVCNTGPTFVTIYNWFLTINKEEIDLLQGVPPADVSTVSLVTIVKAVHQRLPSVTMGVAVPSLITSFVKSFLVLIPIAVLLPLLVHKGTLLLSLWDREEPNFLLQDPLLSERSTPWQDIS